MHKIMVGVQFDAPQDPLFFGWDEVNDYIRHGMKVIALEPGGVFTEELKSKNTERGPATAWYFTVILDDYGIDPA
jgi:hypothetical protein